MKMMGEDFGRKLKSLFLIIWLVLLAEGAFAQDGSIISVASDSNRNIVLSWRTSSNHVYIVQRESSLTTTSFWADMTWVIGVNRHIHLDGHQRCRAGRRILSSGFRQCKQPKQRTYPLRLGGHKWLGSAGSRFALGRPRRRLPE
jgi:hypothetical protein